MTIKQILEETKTLYVKNPYTFYLKGSKKEAEIIKNPKDFKMIKDDKGKFIAIHKTKDLYVWTDSQMFHDVVIKELKLQDKKPFIIGYIVKGGKLHKNGALNLRKLVKGPDKLDWSWTKIKGL